MRKLRGGVACPEPHRKWLSQGRTTGRAVPKPRPRASLLPPTSTQGCCRAGFSWEGRREGGGRGRGGDSQLRGVWGAEQVTFPGLLFTLSPRLSPAQFHSLLSELSSYISSEPSSRSIFFISPGWECCGHQGLRSGSSRKALSSTPTLLHNPPLSRHPPSASLPSRSLPVFIFLGWGSLPAPLSCSLLQELEPPAPSGPPH